MKSCDAVLFHRAQYKIASHNMNYSPQYKIIRRNIIHMMQYKVIQYEIARRSISL